MKKIFKKFGLSLATLLCVVCAGVGTVVSLVDLKPVKAETPVTISASDFYISGAGVRLVNDANGVGLRFHTRLTNTEYEKLTGVTGVYKTGTLLIPEIRYDGELTLEDMEKESKYRPVHIDTTALWYEAEEDGFMQSTAYLYNIPAVAYGARYVARSYITYEDGTTVYSYTDKDRWKSMSDIATQKANEEGVSETLKAQVAPYVVETIEITYELPTGDVTETVAYGSKLTAPEIDYEESLYALTWQDQYGRTWDFVNDEITLPLTLTPVFSVAENAVTVATSALADYSDNDFTHLNPNVGGETAPIGFSTVSRYDENTTATDGGKKWDSYAMAQQSYNNVSLSAYDEVWFAVKVVNGMIRVMSQASGTWKQIGEDADTTNVWVYFHLTQTEEHIWTVEISVNGKVLATLENQSGAALSNTTIFPNDAISTILYGNNSSETDGGYVFFRAPDVVDTTITTIYSTEVITKELANLTGIPAWNAVKTDASSALADYSGNDYTHLNTNVGGETAPIGFSTVSRYDENTTTTGGGKNWTNYAMAQQSYNNVSLSAYDEVWFAVKVVNGMIRVMSQASGTWKQIGEDADTTNVWVYFHLTQTEEHIWTVEISVKGEVLATLENQSGAALSSTTIFPNDAISTILYGNNETDGGYVFFRAPDIVDTTITTIYSTEVLGITAESDAGTDTEPETDPESVFPALKDTVTIVDSAIKDAYNFDINKDDQSGVTVPEGFTSVSRFDSAAAWTTGVPTATAYDQSDLSSYDEVWFAWKLVNVSLQYAATGVTQKNMDVETDASTATWIYFHLTKTAATVWTVELIAEDGTTIATLSGQSGSNISTLLNDSGNTSADKGWVLIRGRSSQNTASVYSTEIRAVRSAVVGDRVIWSAMDGSTLTDEIELPNGFAATYKKTNFAKGDFAKLDLTDTGYTELRFAFSASAALTLNDGEKTIFANTTYYVTLVKTIDGWNVAVKDASSVYEFTSAANNLSGIFGALIHSETTTVYCTEVRGAHTCILSEYRSLSDDTHQGYCFCGTVMTEAVDCSGGEATCTEKAVCTVCHGEYGALGHSAAWNEANEYVCGVCREVGSVNTQLAQQNVALYTDATSINATTPVSVSIDLSTVTNLTVSDSGSVAVTIDGETCDGKIADKNLTVSIVPKYVFGEKSATFTLTVEKKDFEITAPVLFVTNMITSDAGMLAMKTVLRADGGMYGDGYYMLGNNVVLTASQIYVFGTSDIPFVGTFDGNGHYLQGYRNTQWFDKTEEFQDSTNKQYVEGSLFGVLNGTVKNVAFYAVRLGLYANLVHSGTGTVENVYVRIHDIQDSSKCYSAPIFSNGNLSAGILRNVVFDYNYTSAFGKVANATDIFPAATGRDFTAENVAVYGFDNQYINGQRGNVYWKTVDGAATGTDGSAEGIYVLYKNGTNNGGEFWTTSLNDDLWTIRNGVPMFKSVPVSGDEIAPSTTEPETSAATYYISYNDAEDGAYDAVEFIRDATETSTTLNLAVGVAEPRNTDKKQIIVGTYDEYYGYLSNQPTLKTNGSANYGVYLVDNTIFVLAESEDAFAAAAKELCRRLFGWQQFVAFDVYIDSTDGIVISNPEAFDYTSYVAFASHIANNGMTAEEGVSMGFTESHPFTYYQEMHNALNYFDGYSDDNVFATDGPDDGTTAGQQLCYLARGNKTSFTNMIAHAKGLIVAEAVAKKKIKTINFMIEDNSDYCTCSACSAFSNPSIPQLIFANALSKALAEDATLVAQRRTVNVEFFAYASYAYAPVLTSRDVTALNNLVRTLGITYETASLNYDADVDYSVSTDKIDVLKAEDGLRLWWTTHKANHSFALTHEANDHMYLALQGWIASVGAENIDVFMYQATYRDYFLPLNTWEYQVIWYQELNALGINNYIVNLGDVDNGEEAQTSFLAFKSYIDSRAMVDGNVTFDMLKDEFFGENGYYGKAGPTMRIYFEELVSALESKKQTSNYVDASTFGQYDDVSKADRRQSFFNGCYGYDMPSVAFSHWTSNSGKGAQDLYVYGNLTQQATLERWYKYCQDALKLVDANSVYASRINVEAWFPEYAFLLLQTTYTSNLTWDSSDDVWEGSVSVKAPTSKVITITYQEFYNKVKTAGMAKPSEFYEFNSKGNTTSNGGAYTVYSGWSYYGLYQSFFVNWGVTF